MKMFAAKMGEGREGEDGKPSVGAVYRNLLSKNGFPPMDPEITTAWDMFRYFIFNTQLYSDTLSISLISTLNWAFVSWLYSLSVQKYPQNRMLGWRTFTDGKVPIYAYVFPYIYKCNIEGDSLVLTFLLTDRTIFLEVIQASLWWSSGYWFCFTSLWCWTCKHFQIKTLSFIHTIPLFSKGNLFKYLLWQGCRIGVYGSNCPQWIVAMEVWHFP